MNHQQSLRLESKLYATLRTKMDQMQQLGMSWIEVQFLLQSVDVLSDCRRTLMYTYAFAFYLVKDDNQSIIFEDNQRDLEMATEQLSEFLEGEVAFENLVEDLALSLNSKILYKTKDNSLAKQKH
ncbi:unnamed protein product, partial [Mesorhabditis belari]|uniref:Ariadne domain-containing protein n=1 Tax=Mesorhabditis belari TaxID=2138241 RepID=A0AAF3EKL7_9BILA